MILKHDNKKILLFRTNTHAHFKYTHTTYVYVYIGMLQHFVILAKTEAITINFSLYYEDSPENAHNIPYSVILNNTTSTGYSI